MVSCLHHNTLGHASKSPRHPSIYLPVLQPLQLILMNPDIVIYRRQFVVFSSLFSLRQQACNSFGVFSQQIVPRSSTAMPHALCSAFLQPKLRQGGCPRRRVGVLPDLLQRGHFSLKQLTLMWDRRYVVNDVRCKLAIPAELSRSKESFAQGVASWYITSFPWQL